MTRLPKRTNSQKIGVSAADLLSSFFLEFCNVIPVPQERDLAAILILKTKEDKVLYVNKRTSV
jgi:hypothetical protein